MQINFEGYHSLTDEQKAAVSFTTSINGAISRIPAGYTVEVRNILAGTQFRAVERSTEIPDGYSFQKYIYNGNDYRDGQGNLIGADRGVQDIAHPDVDPRIEVCNLKGWGIRVNKTWTDADYMADRDPAFFAVYTSDDQGNLTLIDPNTCNTVRQMPYGENTLYWYFLPLPMPEVPFDHYEVREVAIENPVIGDDGTTVVSWTAIDPVPGGETVLISGLQKGETARSDIRYTVHYEKGQVTEDSNVRIDEVTNSRPGIVLRKEDWAGNPLQGAGFALTDEMNDAIGTFTSGADGTITTAFLREQVPYTLTETSAPRGFHGLEAPVTITLEDGLLTVGGIDEAYYTLDQGEGRTTTLTIKNRPFELRVVKQGLRGSAVIPLGGVTFALHREVTVDNVTSMDLTPMTGYENLVSVEGTGLVPLVDQNLHDSRQARSFYLVEKDAPDGYKLLSEHVRFTIGPTGLVTLREHSMASLDTQIDPDTGLLTYTITVNNVTTGAALRILKVDQSDRPLEGAQFTLTGDGIEGRDDLVSAIPAGGTDAVIYTNGDIPAGTYILTETATIDGYILPDHPVIITITDEAGTGAGGMRVTATVNGVEISYPKLAQNPATGEWTLRVTNQTGYELPSTGGTGTGLIYLIGAALVMIGGAGLAWKRG